MDLRVTEPALQNNDPRSARRQPRVRFAPTFPPGGGKFIHIGHVAMLLAAYRIACESDARFDIRLDGQPDVEGLLDVMNCCHWFDLRIGRCYLLPTVTSTQVAHFGRGDKTAFSDYELSSSFDDLHVENNTIIVRGNEFSYPDVVKHYDALDNFWDRQRREINLPLVMRQGRKMSKSDGDNTLHWTVLTDWPAERVESFLLKKMQGQSNWEWDWHEFLLEK